MKRYTYHVAFSIRTKGTWWGLLTQPFCFDALYIISQPIHESDNYTTLREYIAKEFGLPTGDAYLVSITSLTLLHEQNIGDDDDDGSGDPDPDLKLAKDLLDRFQRRKVT